MSWLFNSCGQPNKYKFNTEMLNIQLTYMAEKTNEISSQIIKLDGQYVY